MKVHLLPEKSLGRWAAGLMGLFFVTMFLKFTPILGYRFPLPTPAVAVLAVVGGVMAIIALIRKDFSILTILTAILGLLVLFWIGAELAFPH